MSFARRYALILSHTQTISHRDRAGSRQTVTSHTRKNIQKDTSYTKKDACKSNTMKDVNGVALPELDAIVLLEGRNYGIAVSIVPQQNLTMRLKEDEKRPH